jgi:hypothetical protein
MSSTDDFANLRGQSLSDPSGNFVALVAATPVQETRGVYVGTGGDLVFKNEAGVSITFKNVPNGTTLPIRTTQYVSGGGDVVGLY